MHIDQQPSNDDLQAAYQLLRKPDWPAYADIMAAARHYQVIRGAAQRLARGERIERPLDVLTSAPSLLQAPASHPSLPGSSGTCPSLRHGHQRPSRNTFDPKRLASNDRDDDG